MDKSTIIEALSKALEHGNGSLDDLEKLLDRAKSDVVKARKEQEEAAKVAAAKNAEYITELANRLLNDKPTEQDVAFVLNRFMGEESITPDQIKDMKAIKVDLDANIDELQEAIGELVEAFGSLFNDEDKKPVEKPKSKKVQVNPKDEDPDDVIDTFLKAFGLK